MQTPTEACKKPQEATGEISILTEKGDTKHYWNAADPSEVAAVGAVFDECRAKGYTAARMGRGGARGEVITEFDPSAHSIVFIPPVRGG